MLCAINGPRALFATSILFLANVPVVSARRCYYDRYGRYRCTSGLATAARIGLGVGMAVLGLLLLSLLICLITIRRRRALRRNGGLPTPVTGGQYEKPAQHQPGAYEPYPSGTANYTNGAPNYPVNEPQMPSPVYQSGGYAPPNGPPPAHYAPPAGPPPAR